ncbi:hypothetical protein V8G54_020762 [Vigna mungo]|uniref:Peptidyl-tRNA hydrolase n=1 Tax=Vigna mungo TaxID=3915 RepID=A0AAQ3NE79_VIGMU
MFKIPPVTFLYNPIPVKVQTTMQNVKAIRCFLIAGLIGDVPVILAKQQTFMNSSGESVGAIVSYYKIPLKQVLVIFDDLDLPFAKLRLLSKGGHGGHNGQNIRLWDARLACLVLERNYLFSSDEVKFFVVWLMIKMISSLTLGAKGVRVACKFKKLIFCVGIGGGECIGGTVYKFWKRVERRMKSVINHFKGNTGFPRLRIGIGRPPGKMDPVAFVLRTFTKQEREELSFTLQDGIEALRILLLEGFDKSATFVNSAKKMEQTG